VGLTALQNARTGRFADWKSRRVSLRSHFADLQSLRVSLKNHFAG
jgi:hypothetical protein